MSFIPASCAPERRSVALRSPDADVLGLLPRGLRLLRCGGFCDDEAQECAATAGRRVERPVAVLTVAGESQQRRVEVEEETQCGCRCRVRPEVRIGLHNSRWELLEINNSIATSNNNSLKE